MRQETLTRVSKLIKKFQIMLHAKDMWNPQGAKEPPTPHAINFYVFTL